MPSIVATPNESPTFLPAIMKLEKSDDEFLEQIVLALTHFLEIDDLITNIRIFDAADKVTLSFKQSYTHCLLPVETVEEILTGICQTISGALGGAARRKKEGIETETNESLPLTINELAPEFCLPDQYGKKHSLLDHRGKWLLLACYFADETFA